MDDDYNIKPLSTVLPKLSTYVKIYYSETKWMYFLIEDDDLLKNHEYSIKKEFHCKPIYNKKFLKTKTKCYRFS